MKWKDSGVNEQPESNKEEYFDEEQYSPWTKRNSAAGLVKLDKSSVMFVLLGLAIVISVAALLMLLLGNHNDTSNDGRVASLQKRVDQLEERLDKYDGIDAKVTEIWEQAKSFEKFKDRFDRDEASTSLRMDHLTMSLEKLQKQFSDFGSAPLSPVAAALQSRKTAEQQRPSSVTYHTVVPGDTLYSISKRYHIEVKDLLKLNGLKKGSVLKIGQKLRVSDLR
jgi:LysM repeat protein